DVLGILFAVIIGVDGHHLPGFGDELHGADRPIVDRVFVIFAVVGVGDLGATIAAVERYAVDAGRGGALVGEAIAMNTAVIGFDASDPGKQSPRQITRGDRLVQKLLGALIPGHRCGRDAVG